jgi:hypothetical protein
MDFIIVFSYLWNWRWCSLWPEDPGFCAPDGRIQAEHVGGVRKGSFIERRGETCSPTWAKGRRSRGYGGCRWSLPADRVCFFFFFPGAFKTYPVVGQAQEVPTQQWASGEGHGWFPARCRGVWPIPRQPAWAPNFSYFQPASLWLQVLATTLGFSLFCFVLFFETGACYVTQAGPELKILLPRPPECWVQSAEHRYVPAGPASMQYSTKWFY